MTSGPSVLAAIRS